MHLVIQKLDLKKEYNKELVKELVKNLTTLKIVTENQAKYIDIEKILKFTKSSLYYDLQHAKETHKEKPFYIYISANEIYNKNIEEKILIQGVIDLYYIDKNNEIILVDYKTDYVANNNEEELVSKYKKQLSIYKRALEQAFNKKVKSVYIYSIYLGREILIKDL